jgi:hypothetical protein
LQDIDINTINTVRIGLNLTPEGWWQDINSSILIPIKNIAVYNGDFT